MPTKLEVGARVEVNYHGCGNFFQGHVAKVHGNGKFDVAYDDGDSETRVALKMIKLLGPDDQPVAVAGSLFDPASAPAPAPAAAVRTTLDVTVGVFGPAKAGKTTLLLALGGDADPTCAPTMGFRRQQVDWGLGEDTHVKLAFFDLPGSMRGIWGNYVPDVHALMFVVDAAANDVAWGATLASFQQWREDFHGFLEGKPLLVLASKADLPGARTAAAVANALGLPAVAGGGTTVLACVGHPARFGGEFDPRLEQGLDGLLGAVRDDYAQLAARVQHDIEQQKALEKERAAAQEKRVLANLLRTKAFPQDGSDPVECLSRAEGLEFLAAEVGVKVDELPDLALHVAHLVNYQKLALQICGNMFNPVNKKLRAPLSWEQVVAHVHDRRAEAGLPDLAAAAAD